MKFHQHDPFGSPIWGQIVKISRDQCTLLPFNERQAFFAPAGTRRVFGVPGVEGNNNFFEFRNSKSIKSLGFYVVSVLSKVTISS